MITKTINFNANHYVKVKLTEYGIPILKEYLNEQSLAIPKEYREAYRLTIKPDSNGYYDIQLHELMRIFGNHMIPNKEPFETNMLILAEVAE